MEKKIRIGANLRFSGSWGYRRFQIGCVFVEYDLLIYNFYTKMLCMNFRINLTQFYINFSRQEFFLYSSFKNFR